MPYIAIDNANDKMYIMRMSYTHKNSCIFLFLFVIINGGEKESL